ncbi:MAG: WXG100 family type VII secretion target [Chloroflexi bacterium CFX4]|nr:WXG100 family type VII secretion target [Chloroflexi bacterium CFX4]MDL1924279.1 WXG100 family type VII secretion target [Chloroflexi bacterium CFX3]
MSAPKIQADYSSLGDIAKHFASKAQETNNLIQTVGRCIESLQRGGWLGKGANQFYAEMQNEVSPAMQRLRAALDDASSATSRIAQAMEQHEREAGALFMNGGTGGGTGSGDASGVGSTTGGGSLMDRVTNFMRDMIAGGADNRNGFVKALNKLLGTGVGEAVGKAAEHFLKHGSDAFKKALGGLGGGFLSGAVDLAFAYINGTPINGNAVFDQLTSGGIQGLIGLHPIGRGVLLADAGIQIVGQAAAQGAANNADWLSNNNLARAENIRQTAGRFGTALDNLSIDNRIDGIVGAVRSGVQNGDFLGAVGGVGTELGRFLVGGVGGTVVEGGILAWHTGAGLASRAGDAIGSLTSSAADKVSGFFRSLF